MKSSYIQHATCIQKQKKKYNEKMKNITENKKYVCFKKRDFATRFLVLI